MPMVKLDMFAIVCKIREVDAKGKDVTVLFLAEVAVVNVML